MPGRRCTLVLPDVLVAGENTTEIDVYHEPLVREVAVDVALVVRDQHGGGSPGGGVRGVGADVLGGSTVSPG